jgi:hypothetical protein
MLDNEMPGAHLEAPDTFLRLTAPLWPRLVLALGYTGGARWVALYIKDDKLRCYDGDDASSVGDTSLFLAYKRHPVIAPRLARAHLGSADEPVREWLLVDQAERVLYLAPPEAARRFLAEQWPRWSAPLEYTPAELARLLAEVEETALPLDWAERLEEAVRESRANYRLMQQWLDERRAEHHP